jgi:invasion protein IalB
MQLSEPNPNRDRLLGSAEPNRTGRRRRPEQADSIGGRVLSILAGALLIAIGFVIAVAVGLNAGIVSQEQLFALFSGAGAAARPPAASVQVPAPAAVAAEAPASTGTPALPAAPEARVLRDETFGDWRFVCVEGAAGAENCSIVQQLRVAETGAAVFVWRIIRNAQGGLVGLWQVPETVQLTAGLTLNAGTPQPIILPFDNCGGGSCRVVANLKPEFIKALSGTKTLSASVTLANQQSLSFPLSANGLADAIAALAK